MAHKTLIGGTAYEISGGKTLVNGTAYSIDKGKTLVGGTSYEVGFRPPMATVWVVPCGAGGKVTINGVDYTENNAMSNIVAEVPIGSEIAFANNDIRVDIRLKDATYTYAGKSYKHTVNSNIALDMYYAQKQTGPSYYSYLYETSILEFDIGEIPFVISDVTFNSFAYEYGGTAGVTTCKEGMTWTEWCASSLNNSNGAVYCEGDIVVAEKWGSRYKVGYYVGEAPNQTVVAVKPTDVIVPYKQYNTNTKV